MPVVQIRRREFVTRSASGVLLIASPLGAFAQTPVPQAASQQPIPKRPDPLAATMVQEFVRKAHTDLPGTKALLAEQPSLLNAT